MTTQTAIHAEITTRMEEVLRTAPATAVFTFKGAELSALKKVDGDARARRAAVKEATEYHQDRFEIRAIDWERYFFYEELPSDHDLCKVTVVLRRPGMLQEITEEASKKVRTVMTSQDVDVPVHVRVPAMQLYSIIHPHSIAATFLSAIVRSVAKDLAADRVDVKYFGSDTLECQRA